MQAESAEYLKEIDSLAMEFDKQQEAIKALVDDVRKREEVHHLLMRSMYRESLAPVCNQLRSFLSVRTSIVALLGCAPYLTACMAPRWTASS